MAMLKAAQGWVDHARLDWWNWQLEQQRRLDAQRRAQRSQLRRYHRDRAIFASSSYSGWSISLDPQPGIQPAFGSFLQIDGQTLSIAGAGSSISGQGTIDCSVTPTAGSRDTPERKTLEVRLESLIQGQGLISNFASIAPHQRGTDHRAERNTLGVDTESQLIVSRRRGHGGAARSPARSTSRRAR